MTIRHNILDKPRLLRLLDDLKAEAVLQATVCVPPGMGAEETKALLAKLLGAESITAELIDPITASPTGAFLFWSSNHWFLVMPPFPVVDFKFSPGCEMEPLHSMLQQDLLIGLVLIRLGEYGIGVLRGERLLSSKVGTGLVHGRHRKGGSSSRRFERHREKQIEYFLPGFANMPGNKSARMLKTWTFYSTAEHQKQSWHFGNAAV